VISGRITFRADGVEHNLLQDLEHYVRLEERDGRIVEVSKDETGWRKTVERLMAPVRGKEIAMIFQSPKSALNPFARVGDQITEAIRLHTRAKDPGKRRSGRSTGSSGSRSILRVCGSIIIRTACRAACVSGR